VLLLALLASRPNKVRYFLVVSPAPAASDEPSHALDAHDIITLHNVSLSQLHDGHILLV
jgi:hypothetical protein